MNNSVSEYFHDFRQEMLAGAEARNDFQLSEFMNVIAEELTETGFIDGFEFCHFRAHRGIRVDGYWFNDEGSLDLFIADFECREVLSSLTKTEVNATFKRLRNFLEVSLSKPFYQDLEETSPEYGLSRLIAERCKSIYKINYFLFSERSLSDRFKKIEDNHIFDIPCSFHIWDMTRLHRQRASRGHKEALEINFEQQYGHSISCLPAHLGSHLYQSFLIVMPASILADLYGKYGARLLEQNVRCFLQARGNVNKGVRATILNEPEMFFAYNNGITATAQKVKTRSSQNGLELVEITDLQIVNGGQTTASLFHTSRKDKASLESIFVQVKLSVIDSAESEEIVPRISEYANTQNRVNTADFFSNHPFHIRMEEFSRRLWAPPIKGAQRETKWFYERARGQYADAQANLTPGEKRKFKAENPKSQMFSKTDLAKFENVWDEHPRWVNLGAQKNFAQYATRIGKEWSSSSDNFNVDYFKRIVARAIIFRTTERMVSDQEWYSGGYRANIVAYTIAVIAECCRRNSTEIDFVKIWNKQDVPQGLMLALKSSSQFVNDHIISPPPGYSNISEWCKKEGCWSKILESLTGFESELSNKFRDDICLAENISSGSY